MKTRISTLLTYLGVIWLVVAWLVVAWLICGYSLFQDKVGTIQVVLFGLPFIAFIIISIINFRDEYGRLVLFEKVRIPKLYVAIALFLFLLLALYKLDSSTTEAKNHLEFIQAALFILLCIAAITASTINFRDEDGKLVSFEKVRIPKLYVAIGLLFIPLIVLYGVTDIKYDKIFFKNFLEIFKIVLFVVIGFCLLIASTINFREQDGTQALFKKVRIPKLYVAIGLLFIPLIVLYGITAIKYDKIFSKIDLNTIQAMLFGLLTLATIILSTINFRDEEGKLVLFEKVNIPRLYVAIGCVLFFLLVPYGATLIHKEKVSAQERINILETVQDSKVALKADIGNTEATLKADIGNTEDALKTRIGNTEATLKTDIGNTEATLKADIGNTEATLKADIGNTEATLKTDIGNTEATLKTDIGNTEDALKTDIGNTEATLKTRIGNTEATLKADIGNTEDALKTRIGNTEATLKTDIEISTMRLTTRLNTVENSLNSINRKVQTASDSVASLSTKIDSLMALSSKIDSLIEHTNNKTDS